MPANSLEDDVVSKIKKLDKSVGENNFVIGDEVLRAQDNNLDLARIANRTGIPYPTLRHLALMSKTYKPSDRKKLLEHASFHVLDIFRSNVFPDRVRLISARVWWTTSEAKDERFRRQNPNSKSRSGWLQRETLNFGPYKITVVYKHNGNLQFKVKDSVQMALVQSKLNPGSVTLELKPEAYEATA